MKNIVVVGFSTRNIVCSGSRAGYNMYSIDAFCDHDLLECSAGACRLETGETFDTGDISLEGLKEMIGSFDVDIDGIVQGSGFEAMDLASLSYNLLGNAADVLGKVSDKYLFSGILERMGIPHPRTFLFNDIDELELPVMVKPACSGGGIFNKKVRDQTELRELKRSGTVFVPPGKERLIAQEYIDGVVASVSVISTQDEAVAIAVNEQLTGTPWLTSMPFAYCGNITPFDTPYASEMKRISEELVLELGLAGSNGVDFIITEHGPVVLEVNARFQGSLDTVEMTTGMNLFDAHLQALNGNLVALKEQDGVFAGRVVIYADRRMVMTEEVQKMLFERNVCDVPVAGQVIALEEPVISVLCSGRDRDSVLARLKESVIFIRESLNLLEP